MSSAPSFWFIPYRYPVPADLERWFEERATEGLMAEDIGQLSSFRMRLIRRTPATWRYVVDVQAAPRPDYRVTYEDLGWEHVGKMASLHVWRRAYTGQRPEAFTDAASAISRNLRFAGAIGAAAAILLTTSVVLVIGAIVTGASATGASDQLWVSAGFVGAIGLAIGGVALVVLRARSR